MARLSRGLVMVMVIVSAILLCSHQQAEATATATASLSWRGPCSVEARLKIEECMKEDTDADIDRCCPILHSLIDNSCSCWFHAMITDRQIATRCFTHCDIVRPLCSTTDQVYMLLIN
ncbi:hypothetical protein P3S67_004241 [Capsicum chacoense]